MDIANTLVGIVVRTRRLEDVLALSSVNKQFLVASTPIWRVLSRRHDFCVQVVLEEWRKKFNATSDPEQRHYMIRAAAFDAARAIRTNLEDRRGMISALRFMHHATGMVDQSVAPEAPRLIIDGLWPNQSDCADFILSVVKDAYMSGLSDVSEELSDRLEHGIPKMMTMMSKDRELDILRVLIAFTSWSHPGEALPLALRAKLSLAFKVMPPNDKWTLARCLIRHHECPDDDDSCYKGERAVWNHVLRQVLTKLEDGSLFEQDKHSDLSLILWQSCRIAESRRTNLSKNWLTKLMDAGVREQLRAYPYLSKSDLVSRMDPFPESAPWPLIFLAWVCHSEEPKNPSALFQEIERSIADKSIRFIKSAHFQKLKTCCVHHPATGLRDWTDFRTRSWPARAQSTLDKKFG
ncbi:MAG: hypothetical protein JWP36_2227 [Paucimonas sp.]|nr:hypothetical protein [Paucimonas sp.]